MKLGRDVKGSKMYTGSTKKAKENVSPMAQWDRKPSDRGHGKDWGAKFFLCFIFCWKDLASQVLELPNRVFVSKSLLAVEEGRVRHHFSQLDTQVHMDNSDAFEGVKMAIWHHHKASITLRRLQSEKVLNDWKKTNVTPVFKKDNEDPCN